MTVCRRRRKGPFSSSDDDDDDGGDSPPRAGLAYDPQRAMAPRSFEHQIYITMVTTGYRMVFLSKGLISMIFSHLEGISNFCAIYAFTGILFTGYVGLMIKHQPLFIKGIDDTNQEVMKESAFGAMGMFIFIWSSSVIYICIHKNRDEEGAIRAQGYMRPHMQAGGQRLSDYEVEIPYSESSQHISDDHDDDDHDEFTPVLS